MKIDGINGYNSDIIKETYRSSQEDGQQAFADLLERAQEDRDSQRLREACKEMEAVFVNIVFDRMRATVKRDGLIEESLGENIFASMLDGELAQEISKGEGVGIADLLYKQLSKNTDR